MTTAREIMHPGAECIGEDDNLMTAAQKMRDLDVGALPICGNNNRLQGIITDRDIVIRCCAEGLSPRDMTARDFAQGDLHWVESGADINEVLNSMRQHQVKRVPVIEEHRLVGMISEADLGSRLSQGQVADFVEDVYGERGQRREATTGPQR